MRWLIVLALMTPISVWANCSSKQTEKVIVKTILPDGREIVSTDVTSVCKEEIKDRLSRCRTEQWDTFHGTVNTRKVCAEWNEYDATTTALTYAHDGVTIQWIDVKGKFTGEIIAHTLPRSQEGWCRRIQVIKNYGSSEDITNRIMCYSEGRGWQYWRR